MNEISDTPAAWEADSPLFYEGGVPPVDITGEAPGKLEEPATDADWMITAPDTAGEASAAPAEVRERLPETTYGAENPPQQLDERTYIADNAITAPLDYDSLQDRHVRWWGVRPVDSTFTGVGLIKPTPEEIAALGSREMTETKYGMISTDSPLWEHVAALDESFRRVVEADIERHSLDGDLRTSVRTGRYTEADREPPHSDNLSPNTVRWTAAIGLGSTIGYNGTVSLAHINNAGDLLGDVGIGEGKQLQEVTFPEGHIIRFRGCGDIHAGPLRTGGRILLMATLHL